MMIRLKVLCASVLILAGAAQGADLDSHINALMSTPGPFSNQKCSQIANSFMGQLKNHARCEEVVSKCKQFGGAASGHFKDGFCEKPQQNVQNQGGNQNQGGGQMMVQGDGGKQPKQPQGGGQMAIQGQGGGQLALMPEKRVPKKIQIATSGMLALPAPGNAGNNSMLALPAPGDKPEDNRAKFIAAATYYGTIIDTVGMGGNNEAACAVLVKLEKGNPVKDKSNNNTTDYAIIEGAGMKNLGIDILNLKVGDEIFFDGVKGGEDDANTGKQKPGLGKVMKIAKFLNAKDPVNQQDILLIVYGASVIGAAQY